MIQSALPSFTVTRTNDQLGSFIPWTSCTTVSPYFFSKIDSSLLVINTGQTHMDSTIATTSDTMRITVILLALAAVAVALPSADHTNKKVRRNAGLSQSFSFSLLFCSTRR